MSTLSTNYTQTGEAFSVPADEDEVTDISAFLIYPLAALENHTHASGRGAAVARVATDAIVTLSITDQNVTSRKVALTSSTQDVLTSETTTSTSYTDLSTSGPAVTLTPGVTQKHLLTYSASMLNSGSNLNAVSVAIAAAAASDNDAATNVNTGTGTTVSATRSLLASSQSSGAVHTLKYRVGGGTGTFNNRRIVGLAI